MENGEENQEEENEEQSPYVPDLGLPSDESVNHGQGGNGGAAGGTGGGGEAPLSFRRFLEPAGPVGLGRPDVAAGLPDFVQDHLAPAPTSAARDVRAAAATGTRRKVPSTSSPAAGGAAALPPSQPQGLPDFLSDGPMGSLHAAGDGPGRAAPLAGGLETSEARPRAGRPAVEDALLRIQRLDRENACLRRDIERLQQQLQQERRRSACLQSQLDSRAAAAPAPAAASPPAPPTACPPSPAAEEGSSRLREEVRTLRAENAELRRRADSGALTTQRTVTQLEAAAESTELLISQLTSGLRSLRSISASLGSAAAAPEGDGQDPDPDLSGDPPC